MRLKTVLAASLSVFALAACATAGDAPASQSASAPAAAPEAAAKSPAKTPAKASYPEVQDEAAFRGLYKELIEINTTASEGSCTNAAKAMQARLLAAGYPESDTLVIAKPGWPQDGNLIATLPGSDPSLKPIMLLAHIDVVEAKREDWERDPFVLSEEDGYFYARGASDDKAMAAIWTDAMVRYKQEGFKPQRSIKLALTCGEEGIGERVGVKWLVDTHPDLVDAAFALNEGAGGVIDEKTDAYLFNGVQAGEKLYQDFKLEVTNPGGHSSRPKKDNAIYHLSKALLSVGEMDFPIEFNDATRTFFTRMADLEKGPIAEAMRKAPSMDAEAIAALKEDPTYNALLHTTCVGTMVDAGHAPNALPQRATANVNCRIFPGHSPEEIRQALIKGIADDQVSVTFADEPETSAPAPKLDSAFMNPVESLTAEMFPGVPVVPAMATGATDGRFLNAAGVPTYGVSGIFAAPGESNAHGLNEKMRVKSLMEGREFLYRLVKKYTVGE
ncbi:MAG: M20/M25/M40 family metallo-hydrolase [Hyphomonadaceae bacterium]